MESEVGCDPVSGARWEVHGPTDDAPIVEAWADSYIRFDGLPVWQQELRDEIRNRCHLLEPAAGQVLHTKFFGVMPPRSDVENLLLYNIDETFQSFKPAGRNGIRFEHGADAPALAPDGTQYPFGFRYAFALRGNDFVTTWKLGRPLASFDWTDLGDFAGQKLALVWLALVRGGVEPSFPVIEPRAKFAVKVQIRPPRGQDWVLGKLMKPIIDGVISAFQVHANDENLTEIAKRLAKVLPAYPEEIQRYLRDQRRAVLGSVPQLFFLHGAGVKGNPSDHLCVSGELLPADPIDDRWAIKGELIELSR